MAKGVGSPRLGLELINPFIDWIKIVMLVVRGFRVIKAMLKMLKGC